jgi:hypothetical protein
MIVMMMVIMMTIGHECKWGIFLGVGISKRGEGEKKELRSEED